MHMTGSRPEPENFIRQVDFHSDDNASVLNRDVEAPFGLDQPLLVNLPTKLLLRLSMEAF